MPGFPEAHQPLHELFRARPIRGVAQQRRARRRPRLRGGLRLGEAASGGVIGKKCLKKLFGKKVRKNVRFGRMGKKL